jgi:hypothetical protein
MCWQEYSIQNLVLTKSGCLLMKIGFASIHDGLSSFASAGCNLTLLTHCITMHDIFTSNFGMGDLFRGKIFLRKPTSVRWL